ncbi:MAG: CoA transferase [Caldilineaceae bacterium]|nr:CoA transferase [Caldilineaceae bacterium]
MDSALSDVMVLDLSRVLAGPYASMMLGDMGARVIKVEQPGLGDDTRRWGPPFTENGESAYFFCANRNKESITLDLKSPGGRAVLLELAAKADVVIENFRAGTAAKLGIDFASLGKVNQRLVYCSITGYGQTGPYKDHPGYDTAIQALGGIMSITGPSGADGTPYKVGVAIADITTGLHAAIAILGALHHARATGEGQQIDIALFDVQLSWLANVATAYFVSGQAPGRYGNGHASIVPYQAFATTDGWLMLAVGNDRQFRNLAAALEKAEWADDPRYAANPARVAHREELVPLLEEIFGQKSTETWLALLHEANVPCNPVNDIPAALTHPQTLARQMVQTVEHPVTGAITQLGPVPKLSLTPAAITSPPPLLGEQTEAVLSNLLGYTKDDIEELRRIGAI